VELHIRLLLAAAAHNTQVQLLEQMELIHLLLVV
jgi:hypothetical protein